MSGGSARRELMRVRELIRTHRDKSDHARCWLNDLILYGKALPETKPPGMMTLPKPVLMDGCSRYIDGQKRRLQPRKKA